MVLEIFQVFFTFWTLTGLGEYQLPVLRRLDSVPKTLDFTQYEYFPKSMVTGVMVHMFFHIYRCIYNADTL